MSDERFNPTFVRCDGCQKMVSYEKRDGTRNCGESLPDPPSYW